MTCGAKESTVQKPVTFSSPTASKTVKLILVKMATSNRARVPTPKQLSSVGVKKDEFETFWHILVTYCQQDSEYLEFFEGGAYAEWQALSVNPTRGINVQADPAASILNGALAVREANRLSVIKRATLNSLLTTIAAYCPEGLFKTVLADSTSINWIRNRLIKVCNIESNGRHLPKILNIKYGKGEESPAAFYERIKSSFLDSLMPAGTNFHGVPLTSQETLGPTLESMIVVMCLKAIHPELPDFIMQNKGMLFTTTTPNFCDIQGELWETMDTLLAQMEAQDSVQRLKAVDSAETLRWANTQTQRSKGGSRNFSTNKGSSFSRPGPVRQSLGGANKQICEYCQALGKDEKIWSSHDKLNCFSLFPEKRKTKTQARMLSVPVYTDEMEVWDLQQALEAVEDQFYATQALEEDTLPLPGGGLSPQ